MESKWIPSFSLEELVPGQGRTLRDGARQVAVFLLEDGTVRAVDNRCPHQGYPLVAGTVCGSVLTCPYHNFKFDLRDGACLVGDERVSLVPVRVEGGKVEVDLAEPDRTEERPRRWESLRVAVSEGRVGQTAREVVRLLSLGEPPEAIARFAANWDGDHAEYGATHALAVASDALRLLPSLSGLEAASALVPALELASDASARRPAHPPPSPIDPGDPGGWVDRLREAIEAEDPERATGLIRGAIGRGSGRGALEPALLRIASDHLFDYGHGLIYATKIFALGEPQEIEAALIGLVRGMVYATRDDQLPSWTPWRRRMEEIAPELPRLPRRGPLADQAAFSASVLEASPRDSVELVLEALRSGASPLSILDALSIAASERLLGFDIAHDRDPGVEEGWLDVTHLSTFAAAIRDAMARCDHPDLLRLLFQLSRQIARLRPLCGARIPEGVEGGIDALLEAIRSQDTDRATALALRADPAAARPALIALSLEDAMVLPIFHAHGIKLALAAGDEAEALGDRRPLAAAARFLASAKRERRTGQRISEAIRLVRDGRPPRVLAV